MVGVLEYLGIIQAALAHDFPDRLQRFKLFCIESFLQPGKKIRHMAGAFRNSDEAVITTSAASRTSRRLTPLFREEYDILRISLCC